MSSMLFLDLDFMINKKIAERNLYLYLQWLHATDGSQFLGTSICRERHWKIHSQEPGQHPVGSGKDRALPWQRSIAGSH